MYGAFPLLVFNAFFSVKLDLFKILINPKAAHCGFQCVRLLWSIYLIMKMDNDFGVLWIELG